MTGTTMRHCVRKQPMIPRQARLHDARRLGVSSAHGSVDVSHDAMRSSNLRSTHFSWRQKKVQEWQKKAIELDEAGLFVAAGVARDMAAHYGRRS